MRGFTDKALLLLSDVDKYEESGSMYKYDYKQAVANILRYLNSAGMQHHCLITDALATEIVVENTVWLATGAVEDMFFAKNYCGVPSYDTIPLEGNICDEIRKKYPIARGTSVEETFKAVSSRVKMAEQKLIASYRFVVVFGNSFKVKSKSNDGRAVMRVNDRHFYTSMELGGEGVPINSFMQIPYANLCLSEWGKYDGSANHE